MAPALNLVLIELKAIAGEVLRPAIVMAVVDRVLRSLAPTAVAEKSVSCGQNCR